MFALGLLLLIVIIGAVVYAAVASSRGRGAQPPRRPVVSGGPQPGTPGADRDLAATLTRWVTAGLLSQDESAAILDHESRRMQQISVATPAAAPQPGAVTAHARRVPVVAEALGYLGGMLAIIGLVLVVARYWPDMATATRLGLSGAGALALLGAGFAVPERSDPALTRLRWFVWLASTAAAALFAGVLTADALDTDVTTVVVGCSGAVALESGLLWWGRVRPIQQLTFLGGVAAFAGALMAEFAIGTPVGLTVWIVGAAFLALALRERGPLPALTAAVGAITMVAGAVIVAADWATFGLPFTVGTAFLLVALAVVPGLVKPAAMQLELGIIGAIAVTQSLPGTLGYFGQDAGLVTGLLLWTGGGLLVLVGAKHLIRLALAAEVLGCMGLIGGAALTGAQSTGFATLFGIATAVGLIALGMLPGQVLLSLFGSVALLINVPWAIAWFFPGEGRAPLLILVSGALILVIAVLLTRMGGRFKSDLGGRGPGAPRVA